MKKHKTDESVKAGLQLEADTNPLKRNKMNRRGSKDKTKEKNADEMLHEQEFEPTASFNKENPEEPEHKTPPVKTVRDPDGRAADDLVHER